MNEKVYYIHIQTLEDGTEPMEIYALDKKEAISRYHGDINYDMNMPTIKKSICQIMTDTGYIYPEYNNLWIADSATE